MIAPSELIRWLVASFAGCLVVVMSLILAPYILPDIDHDALYRYFLLRIPATMWGIIALVGGFLFLDYITPGDWLKRAEDDPMACAIVSGAIVIGLALIICYG